MRTESEIQKKLNDLEKKLEDHLLTVDKIRLPDSRFYTIKYQLMDEIRALKWVLEISCPYSNKRRLL